MKKLLLSLLLVFSASGNAVQCDFEAQEGKLFTFEKTSAHNNFKNKGVYSSWYVDSDGSKNISYNQYYARKGKLRLDFVEKEVPSPTSKFDKVTVRYYPAYVENCETVYLKVEESDSRFKQYFNDRNWLNPEHPNFTWEESIFNIAFVEQFENVKKHIGQFITIKPLANGAHLPYRSNNYDHYGLLESRQQLKLLGFDRNPFDKDGVQYSPYQLIVEKNGEKLFVPWDPEMIHLGDFYQNQSIRHEFLTDVLTGNIRYGMNKFEVQASWGIPDLVRRQVIYLEEGKGEFVNDELYPYAKESFIQPKANSIPNGIESDWYYFSRLDKGQYLVFDKFGLLWEHNQVFRINRNTVHNALNRIIKPEIK